MSSRIVVGVGVVLALAMASIACQRVVKPTSKFVFQERSPFVRETNFHAHSSYIFYGAFSSDGEYLATGSADRTIKIWRTSDWNQVATIREQYQPLWGMPLAFAGSGLLVYGAYDSLCVWDMKERRTLLRKKGHKNGIQTIRAVGNLVATGGADGFVRLWKLPDLSLVQEKKISMEEVWSLVVDEKKGVLIAGGEDGFVSVFTFPDLLPIFTGAYAFGGVCGFVSTGWSFCFRWRRWHRVCVGCTIVKTPSFASWACWGGVGTYLS